MLDESSEFIEEKMGDKDIPGLSISLVEENKVVWQQGYGYSNKAKKIKSTPQSIYAIGSLTTLVTATAIMQLVEDKKFNLDDKVSTLLPQVFQPDQLPESPPPSLENKPSISPIFDRSITVRDLLTHHSGLATAKHKGMWSATPEHYYASIQYAVSQPAPYPPQTIFSHSNIGYSLLGLIIETYAKKNYQRYISEDILPAMGLHHTHFHAQVVNQNNLSKNYKEGKQKKTLLPRDIPSLGLYSTVEDLGKLAQIFLSIENSTINKNIVNEMLRPQNTHVTLDFGKQTGIGWTLAGSKINNVGLVVHRYGTSLFHRSRILLIPEHEIAIAVVANDSTGFRAVEEISEQVLSEYIKLKSGIEIISEIEPSDVKPLFNTTEFKSRYASRIGLVTLKTIGQHIEADVLGWNFKLNKEQNGWFNIEYKVLGILPFKLDWISDLKVASVDVDGVNYLISHFKGTQYLFGQALTPSTQTGKYWKQHIGEYQLSNPDELSELYEVKNGDIKMYNDTLIFEYELPFWFPLYFQIPIVGIDKNTARVAGIGTGYNEIISVTNIDNTKQLNFSGYLLKHTTQ